MCIRYYVYAGINRIFPFSAPIAPPNPTHPPYSLTHLYILCRNPTKQDYLRQFLLRLPVNNYKIVIQPSESCQVTTAQNRIQAIFPSCCCKSLTITTKDFCSGAHVTRPLQVHFNARNEVRVKWFLNLL